MACTSFVNANVIKSSEDVGFQHVFLAPLQVKCIQQEIIPLVKERADKIERMNEMSKLSDMIGDMKKPNSFGKRFQSSSVVARLSSNIL